MLVRLGLIVLAADIKGQESVAVESLGLRALAAGFAAMGLSDEQRLERQFPVYDALYEYRKHVTGSHDASVISTGPVAAAHEATDR